jgi:hypothetical protein
LKKEVLSSFPLLLLLIKGTRGAEKKSAATRAERVIVSSLSLSYLKFFLLRRVYKEFF